MARARSVNPKRTICISIDAESERQLLWLAKRLGGTSGLSGAVRFCAARVYGEQKAAREKFE